jgi:hypothetical protein
MKTREANSIIWNEIKSDTWASLIGRPRLTLKLKGKVIRCGNITCGKIDHYKHYKESTYVCQCGYSITYADLEIIKHKTSIKCGVSKCPEQKSKMDMSCLKCQYVKEV